MPLGLLIIKTLPALTLPNASCCQRQGIGIVRDKIFLVLPNEAAVQKASGRARACNISINTGLYIVSGEPYAVKIARTVRWER